MTYAAYNAIQVVADITAALALPLLTLGVPTQFLLAGTKQQNRGVGYPDANRVSYFERQGKFVPDGEKANATYGTMTTRHSASFGLDMVYPGPYPGKGHSGYTIKNALLTA